MTESDDRRAAVELEAEISVSLRMLLRVSDWAALRSAGHRVAADQPWVADEAERARLVAAVDSGPYGALSVLMDPDNLLDYLHGVELVESHIEVGPAKDQDESAEEPDFAELFPLDVTIDGEEGGWLLTPRTAAVLHGQLETLSDFARDEAEELGDAPVISEAEADLVFGALPRITWRQDARWRIRFVEAFDDLADDLAAGRLPQPRCPAEEMALHLTLVHAESQLSDDPELVEHIVAGLPVSPHDYDWDGCRDVLFQDEDILWLYDPQFDGVEDPEADINQKLRMGDYRPGAWSDTFHNMPPRDGRTG